MGIHADDMYDDMEHAWVLHATRQCGELGHCTYCWEEEQREKRAAARLADFCAQVEEMLRG